MQQVYPIITEAITKQLSLEIYVQPPSDFVINNYLHLLPAWKNIPKSIIIVLFLSDFLLENNNVQIELEKNRLKKKFLNLGNVIQSGFQPNQGLIEIIDPQTGNPSNSAPGKLSFDVVAVVHQLLNFKFHEQNSCKVLHHPIKKTAIYPSLLLSDSECTVIQSVIKKMFLEYNDNLRDCLYKKDNPFNSPELKG